MVRKYLLKNNRAVAGVVEAVLLIALVAVIISMIQVIYIPQIMEQRESDHMDQVANQFSHLKSVIDLQAMMEVDNPISTTITLGSAEIPYFVTARAFGQVNIFDDNGYIRVDNGSFNQSICDLTSIKFQSHNSYFLDQSYIIEGGSLIVNQSNGETVLVKPSLSIDNLTDEINIRYTIPVIYSMEGKNSTSGYKTCSIRTNYSYSDSDWIGVLNVSRINISTEHSSAWYDIAKNVLENNVNIDKNKDCVKITKDIKEINFYYKRAYIYGQISPGWIT